MTELEIEIINYCKVNQIEDIEAFKIKLLKQGFTIEKYGVSPVKPKVVEKIVEKFITNNEDTERLATELEKLKKDFEELLNENKRLLIKSNENKIIKKDIYGEE